MFASLSQIPEDHIDRDKLWLFQTIKRIPKQTRGIESKEKIIKASMVLVTKKRHNKTNAPERASAATGTFYRYFNNKKEIFIEIIRKIFTIFLKKCCSISK